MSNIDDSGKKFIIGSGIILFTIFALWGVWKISSKTASSSANSREVTVPLTEKEWIKGPENAPVTIIEFSDFQCPACKAYSPLVEEVLSKNPQTVRLVYKHMPLAVHNNALEAAFAAEAAGNQGMFFEMHDLLFKNQSEWESAPDPKKQFEVYASELELDMTQYYSDSASQEVKDKVAADAKIGNDIVVSFTPSFVINGKLLQNNPQSLEEFQALIDAELEGVDLESYNTSSEEAHLDEDMNDNSEMKESPQAIPLDSEK